MAGDRSRKLFFVAGEPSGDTHAAAVLAEIRRLDPTVQARGYGGPRMQQQGFELLHDLASEGVMGLFPVLAALPRLSSLFHRAVEVIKRDRPDAVVLVDYPGFNLRLARKVRKLGIRVIGYISPQVWAWHQSRIARVARDLDLLLVILPFEEAVYKGSGLDCRFVGHPVMDHLRARPPRPDLVLEIRAGGKKPHVGVFPGSRRHVVRALLPVFVQTLRHLRGMEGTKDASAVVALAREEFRPMVMEAFGDQVPVRALVDSSLEIMSASDVCLTTSGTTTLEIAATGTPFVLGYRVSPVLYAIGKRVLRVPFIGLVNLVAERKIVPEHVSWRSFSKAAAADLHRLLTDTAIRETQIRELEEVRRRLDTQGSYARTAEAILAAIRP